MRQSLAINLEERARVTEIQDLLIDRLVEHRESTERGHVWQSRELRGEIEELWRKKENLIKLATSRAN